MNATTVGDFFTEAVTTIRSTTEEAKNQNADQNKNGDGVMSTGAVVGTIIGAIAGVVISLFVAFIVTRKYRAIQRRKKCTETYKAKEAELKINKLPTLSELEGAEIKPPNRKPKKSEAEVAISDDLQSSTKQHYQNVNDSNYENLEGEDVKQPIYLEPSEQPTKLYSTGEGSEYYVVDTPLKTPTLPTRNDPKDQKHSKTNQGKHGNTTKNKVPKPKGKNTKSASSNQTNSSAATKLKKKDDDSGSSSESDNPTHSAKDYVNLKDNPIQPPKPKQTVQLDVEPDEVYENEEIPKSPRPRQTKR